MNVNGSSGTEAHPLASVGRGTTVMVVSTALLFVFSFVGRVAVARAFSVAEWGLFNLGLSLTGVLSIIGLLGIHQAVARTLSYETDPAVKRGAVRWGLVMSGLSAAALSATIFAFAGPLASLFDSASRATLTAVFQLLAVTVGFVLLSTYIASIFQGFEDAGPNAWYNQVVSPGLFVIFLFLFLALHLGFYWAVGAYTLASGVAFGAIALHAWRRLPRLLPKHPGVPARTPSGLASLSVSLWGVTSLTFVTAYIDTLVLGVYRPATAVGLYSAGMTLARLLLIGAGALTYIYLPVAARLVRSDRREEIRASYVTSTRWIIVFTLPLFLLFALLPGLSLRAVFGASYAGGAAALAVIAWGAFVSTAVGPSAAALAGMGYARTLLVITSVSAGTNLAASFGLIPTYGLFGAAVAWTLARLVYTFGGSYALWRSDRVTPLRRRLTIPLGLSLAVGIPVFFAFGRLPLPEWAVVPLFFLATGTFIAATVFTRNLDPGDLVAVGALERLLRRPLPSVRAWLARYVAPREPPTPVEAAEARGPNQPNWPET